jgi:hypothetical protein
LANGKEPLRSESVTPLGALLAADAKANGQEPLDHKKRQRLHAQVERWSSSSSSSRVGGGHGGFGGQGGGGGGGGAVAGLRCVALAHRTLSAAEAQRSVAAKGAPTVGPPQEEDRAAEACDDGPSDDGGLRFHPGGGGTLENHPLTLGPRDWDALERGLTLDLVVGFGDPLKLGVAKAVAECKVKRSISCFFLGGGGDKRTYSASYDPKYDALRKGRKDEEPW